jgi:hypothetical protein
MAVRGTAVHGCAGNNRKKSRSRQSGPYGRMILLYKTKAQSVSTFPVALAARYAGAVPRKHVRCSTRGYFAASKF